MKESEIYKRLQEIVLESLVVGEEEKLEILRHLFKQEELALFTENHAEQGGQKEV